MNMGDLPTDALAAIDWLRQEPATDDRRGTHTDYVLTMARIEIIVSRRAKQEAADEVKQLRAEVEEQCRLNGMGAERELRLMAERNELARELAKLEKQRGDFGREVEQAAHTVIDAIEAERDALRAALVMAREQLPKLDSLPRTPTRIREIVEVVEVVLGATASARAVQEDAK
jgi:seryl-tRNA synthetase